jgi:HK97 family phage major capsid protein
VTADLLVDLQHSLVPDYAGRGFWLMNNSTWASIRKLKNADNRYLVEPALISAGQKQLLGQPVVIDPNMPNMAANAKSILFGDFSGYVIRDAGQIRIERSDDYAFANDLVTFRYVMRTDGDLVDESAIRAYQNGAT